MQSPGSVAFTVFGIDIMWYGILIASAMLIAVLISYRRAPRFGIESDSILDLCLWMLPIGVIGTRVYYVIFNYDIYRGSLSAMLNFRNGGLAIHGGLIAGLLTAYIFCRKRSLPILDVCDLILPSVALAQAIGRWGNFFNGEAYGVETTLPWAIVVDGRHVHPTFLYESIWCLLLFVLLSYLCKKRVFSGQIACLYGILYSLERFFVEGLRTDSLMIGPFRQAQVISITTFAICIALYILLSKTQHKGDNK